MENIINKHKICWLEKAFVSSALVGILFFIGSLIVNYAATTYSAERASSPVTDIVLDNLPVVNTDAIFIYGSILFIIFIAFLLARDPKRIPFVLKSVALFIIIRSFFITLTHIGPSPENTLALGEIGRVFSSGADLFFSGHTGLPFLFALMYWKESRLRSIFLLCSIVAGVSVLLGHVHYSIDVAAAFFITYSIFHIAQTFFKKDYKTFLNGLETPQS